MGSPPPMRGKADSESTHGNEERITPAYAGKSSGLWNTGLKRKDHPRLCGEKKRNKKEYLHHMGSPPPMRGKVPAGGLWQPPDGITPAYAGKRCTKHA